MSITSSPFSVCSQLERSFALPMTSFDMSDVLMSRRLKISIVRILFSRRKSSIFCNASTVAGRTTLPNDFVALSFGTCRVDVVRAAFFALIGDEFSWFVLRATTALEAKFGKKAALAVPHGTLDRAWGAESWCSLLVLPWLRIAGRGI